MLGNWIKTFVLMAAITALFASVGVALGGESGINRLDFCRQYEYLCLLVF